MLAWLFPNSSGVDQMAPPSGENGTSYYTCSIGDSRSCGFVATLNVYVYRNRFLEQCIRTMPPMTNHHFPTPSLKCPCFNLLYVNASLLSLRRQGGGDEGNLPGQCSPHNVLILI